MFSCIAPPQTTRADQEYGRTAPGVQRAPSASDDAAQAAAAQRDRAREGEGHARREAGRIAESIEPLRVEPGTRSARRTSTPVQGRHGQEEGRRSCCRRVELLAEYQARLAAQDTYGVLVCLQALDAGGKDGTIRHVMSGVNPQGVQ